MGWIGVDLDGTLARQKDPSTPTLAADEPGEPIPEMLARVKDWLDKDIEVRIFTARACDLKGVMAVRKWLIRQGLGDLVITNVKDMNMVALWDDKAIQVERNTGRQIVSSQ